MAGEGGADGDVGRLAVADFADHDHIGILAQDVPQGAGKRQADLGADLHLVRSGDFVLDRILDGDDAQVGGIDLAQEGVERGGLAGAGRAGDEDDAVRVLEDLDDLGALGLVHAQALHGVGLLLLVEEAERDALGVDRRDGGDADVEGVVAGAVVDAAVLGEALLGDIEARHDLEARDDGVLVAEEVLRHGHGHEEAVHAVADAELALLGFKMDVGRGVVDRLLDHLAHETHDGGIGVGLG